jgi:hypothetical protein
VPHSVDNIISDIVEPNIPDTIANIKQKYLHGRYFKELEQSEINIQVSYVWLKKSNIHPETEGFIFAIQDRVINTRNYKKHICGLQSIIDKCRICRTEGETIDTSFLLAPFWLKANILFDEPLKGTKLLKVFKGENSQILTVSKKKLVYYIPRWSSS